MDFLVKLNQIIIQLVTFRYQLNFFIPIDFTAKMVYTDKKC